MEHPLADRIRPQSLDEVVGQKHLLGGNALLRRFIEKGTDANMVFYGPSGTGKTTIANIVAERTHKALYRLNATTASLQDIKDIIADVGTLLAPGGVLERHWHKLRKTKQPHMDHMMVGCACDIIRRYRPDVMFIHLSHLDHTRHANGVHGPAPEMAVIQNDDWFGRIEEAAMDAGIYDQTNFAVISDHGHLPVKQMFNPNVLLAQAGLTMENVIKTTVFLKDMNDFAAMNEVYAGFFPGNPPARSAVEVARLPKDAMVEIEAIAAR